LKVIVTGIAGALGTVVADRFVGNGDRVAGIARHAAIAADDRQAMFACPDLADTARTREAFQDAAAWLGGLDAVIHVAGGFAFQKVADSSAEDWLSLYRSNLLTSLSVAQAATRLLADGGAIVMVGAASAQPAGAGMAPYAAAKSAVARLVESLAAELAPQRIRANAVLPSIIDTPQNRADMPGADPVGWTTPAAIADTILFLASPAARAINGASLPVTNAA
jgi:NAD(P)-dependent dehydrogenase (short-subunit alcohol dehydrogenase family)